MSQIYRITKKRKTEGDFDSTFAINFQEGEAGQFAVVSLSLPIVDLLWALRRSDRAIKINSDEIAALLKSVAKNEAESRSDREAAAMILGAK